jgi:hypothetical protein
MPPVSHGMTEDDRIAFRFRGDRLQAGKKVLDKFSPLVFNPKGGNESASIIS